MVPTKKLIDICEFRTKSKKPASYGNQIGSYPFYTSSNVLSKFCNQADYDIPCLIIGDGGRANIKYDVNFSCSNHNLILTKNSPNNLKYIYYYLKSNLKLLQDGFVGTCLQNISKKYVENLEIPIPSLDAQEQIVNICEYCDKQNKNINFKEFIETILILDYNIQKYSF